MAVSKVGGWGWLLSEGEAFGADAAAATFQVTVIRPTDLVNLTFLFYNLQRSGSQVVRVDSTKPAFLAVQLAGQHLFEQPWAESSGSPPGDSGRRGDRRPHRLVFEVPAAVTSLPFSLAGLLDWSALLPSLAKGAIGSGTPPVAKPGQTSTALEVPWNLVLSPDPTGRWVASPSPVTANGWTELWHARLGTMIGGNVVEPPGSAPPVRAIWSPDYPGDPAGGDTFQLWSPTSLISNDRSDLVVNTADWSRSPYVPVSANAAAFTVSALGATIDVAGAWPTAPTSLKEWRHRTYLGRDTYVKRVYFGYLFPTGHPATLTIITDREFATAPDGTTTAYLVQRTFVTVRQPVVDYTTWPYIQPPFPNGDRGLPFASIRAVTLSTPPLATSGSQVQVGALDPLQAMWVVEEFAGDVPFRMVGTDWSGAESHLEMSVIFVGANSTAKFAAFDAGVVGQVIAAYDASGSRRDVPLGGQPLAFAPEVNGAPGTTTHPVTTLHFSALGVTGSQATYPDTPWWVASLLAAPPPGDFGALVTLQAIGALSGALTGTTPIAYHPTYLTTGFAAAGGAEIWAVILTGPAVSYSADKSGGIATPNLSTADMGVSRAFGVVSSASQLAPTSGTPSFNPASMFDSSNAGLLGSLHLGDVMHSRDQTQDPNYLHQLPSLQQGGTTPDDILNGVPNAQIFKLAFNYDSKYEISAGGSSTDPLGLLTVTNNSKLAISAVFAIPNVPPGSPQPDPVYAVDGRFDDFAFNLFGSLSQIMVLNFEKLIFHLQTGQSPSVQPDIDSVTFPTGSPLSFLSFLTGSASGGGGGGDSPFSIKPTPSGIAIAFTLPIPNLTAGVLTISNMKFKFQLTIPYTFDEVTTEFAFSEKDHPATLAVWIFGGGFFVDIKLCLLGLQEIEAAAEFGVTAQLDFGVASGGCHVLVGIYFDLKATYATDPKNSSHILPATETVDLEGYFRAGGDLRVLGIVDISIELYLGLGYVIPGKAYGIATLTLKVSVPFFSASVSVQVEKTFGSGSGSDPNFAGILTQSDWSTYCMAFAA